MTKSAPDLVTFTEEILNGKLHFLCSVLSYLFVDEMRFINHDHLVQTEFVPNW